MINRYLKGFRGFIFAIALLAATVFLAGCGFFGATENEDADVQTEETQTVEIETAVAKIEQIPTYLEATGSLASDAESNVAPSISGKIVKVNFDVGSYVKKGDTLVELDGRDAKIRLDQAKAQERQAREGVTQAEAGVAQSIANLRQNQIRLGITRDGEKFDIKDFSQVISVGAQLKLAEQELARHTKLISTGDVSQSSYDKARSQRDALQGQLAEALANASIAVKAITIAEKVVATARAQVAGANAAVRTAATQTAQARKAVSDNIIYSPISGYVLERNADPGEFISPNQPNARLATIVRTAVLRLKIDIPEQSIGKVAIGQGVSAQVSAYPDRNFAGTIVRILPSLNPQSRTLTVEADVENINGLLKPGQFATVRITQSKPEAAVMIPAKAIRTNGEQNLVYVIKDGIANERVVQTGLLEGEMIEIKLGVGENDTVAISNIVKLADGVIVNQ